MRGREYAWSRGGTWRRGCDHFGAEGVLDIRF